MHMDNPQGLANIILNDLLGEQNVVRAPEVQQQDFQELAQSEIIEKIEEEEKNENEGIE